MTAMHLRTHLAHASLTQLLYMSFLPGVLGLRGVQEHTKTANLSNSISDSPLFDPFLLTKSPRTPEIWLPSVHSSPQSACLRWAAMGVNMQPYISHFHGTAIHTFTFIYSTRGHKTGGFLVPSSEWSSWALLSSKFGTPSCDSRYIYPRSQRL